MIGAKEKQCRIFQWTEVCETRGHWLPCHSLVTPQQGKTYRQAETNAPNWERWLLPQMPHNQSYAYFYKCPILRTTLLNRAAHSWSISPNWLSFINKGFGFSLTYQMCLFEYILHLYIKCMHIHTYIYMQQLINDHIYEEESIKVYFKSISSFI